MAKRWYVVHVFSGSEKKMAQAILEQATANGLEDQIADVMVPTEEVVEVRRGAKVQSERKFFPGYILVNMELTDAAWSVVQSQPRVTGFLGGKGRPVPITNAEAERLIKQMDEGVERPRSTLSFDIGEEVRVIEGPFESFNGVVEEADDEKERLKVSVSIFGRSTPVELEYSQVERAV
jgi:transcriptional antiterminator NusG